VAEGLAGARARGRSGEWKLAGSGGKRKRKLWGFLPWVRVGGAVPEGGWRRWTKMVVGWSSVWGEWRHGEVKQRVGRGVVGCCSARGSFIGLEDGRGGGAVRGTAGGGLRH
jgi:hypothetical protein